MKKLVTILLLLIVSIQFLPIKEMGKSLFDNQFVEEEVIKEGIEKCKGITPGKDLIFLDITPQPFYLKSIVFSNRKTALHKPPITDVTTPPPNVHIVA